MKFVKLTAVVFFPLAVGLVTAAVAGTERSDVQLRQGREVFSTISAPPCAVCHTLKDANAKGEIGPNLDEFKPSVAQVMAAVTSGIGVMPPFADSLTPEEIEAVSVYVSAIAGKD